MMAHCSWYVRPAKWMVRGASDRSTMLLWYTGLSPTQTGSPARVPRIWMTSVSGPQLEELWGLVVLQLACIKIKTMQHQSLEVPR